MTNDGEKPQGPATGTVAGALSYSNSRRIG
jgi:hypothetical protein